MLLKSQPRQIALLSYKLRRFVPWFILAALLIFIESNFMPARNLVRSTVKVLEKYTNSSEASKSGPLHVLIVSYARTGSSFTGDILQNIPNSFYHYEPLHFLNVTFFDSSFDTARDMLDRVFNCDISQIDGFVQWLLKRKSLNKLQHSKRYWTECSKLGSCYNGTYIDNFCRNQTSAVIIKTIRLRPLEASKLFTSHPNLNLKIIYLTRDPRGTMNSRMRKPIVKWCKTSVMCSNTKYFCAALSADIETVCSLSAQRPEDFMVIRYEDLCAQPIIVTSRLMKFLGYTFVPEKMYKFLEEHAYLTQNTRRKNSSDISINWRTHMEFQDVMDLQKDCKSFLSAFGYYSYRTGASLRSNINLDTDLHTALNATCSSSSS